MTTEPDRLENPSALAAVFAGFEIVGLSHTLRSGIPSHLQGEDVLVPEGLMLTDVEPGHYVLACLPLKLAGSEGAPARAGLIRNF